MAEETKEDLYNYEERPLIYWRDKIDQKIINAVRMGMQTGLRGHVDFDPLVMERLHEILSVSYGLRPQQGYENGKLVNYKKKDEDFYNRPIKHEGE